MNDNKQRIQCVKCKYFRRWEEISKVGTCDLYGITVMDNHSCILKEKRKKERKENDI